MFPVALGSVAVSAEKFGGGAVIVPVIMVTQASWPAITGEEDFPSGISELGPVATSAMLNELSCDDSSVEASVNPMVLFVVRFQSLPQSKGEHC